MFDELVQHIKKIYRVDSDFLGLHEPRFIGNERKYVLDAIDSTFVSSVGEYVDKFESMICELTGAKYAVALVNGTNSLHLALLLAGVEEGDEVLTQPLSFVATANAISYCRATPNFVDVDKDTLGLSASILERYLDEIVEIRNGKSYNRLTNKKISACVPMHTFGLPLYIDDLVLVCNRYNIPVVEDAAEALGSYYKQKHVGTFGLIGVYSFNGNKIVTSGGGGAIVTNDALIAKKAKHLATQAKIPHRWKYRHDNIGYNYRMPNINAALACAQLEQLDFYLENKRDLSDKYYNLIKRYSQINLVREIKEAKSNYWLNTIIMSNKEERDKFLRFTNDNGVMTRPVWDLLNSLDLFRDSVNSNLNNSIWLADRIVNITSSVRLNE